MAVINLEKRLSARDFGKSYTWSPATGLSATRIATPLFRHNEQVDYTIEIISPAGCRTVDSQLVRIFRSVDIFVPKAFSPNGDGQNDRLDVFLVGVGELKFFRVFNRWVQLLFETKNIKDLWDGTYRGVRQPLETYICIAEGIGEDGSKVVKRGQVLLIK